MVIERRKRAISERAYLAEKNIEVLVKLKQVRFESTAVHVRATCPRTPREAEARTAFSEACSLSYDLGEKYQTVATFQVVAHVTCLVFIVL